MWKKGERGKGRTDGVEIVSQRHHHGDAREREPEARAKNDLVPILRSRDPQSIRGRRQQSRTQTSQCSSEDERMRREILACRDPPTQRSPQRDTAKER